MLTKFIAHHGNIKAYRMYQLAFWQLQSNDFVDWHQV